MNQTISQHFPFDYVESECLGQDRSFPASLLSNDYLQPPYRKTTSRNNTSTQSVSLPINPPNKYSSHPSLHDTSYLPTTALASPPDSLSGSVSTGGNPITSLGYAPLPKLNSSNVSTSDHYQPSSYSQYSFGGMDNSMTEFPRPRPLLHPATLSPPLTFGSGHGIPSTYLGHTRPDPYPHYFPNGNIQSSFHTPANFSDITKYRNNRQSDLYGSSITHTPMMYPSTQASDSSARSSQNRQDSGPPFEATKPIYQVMTRNSPRLEPEISAGIQKGFFEVEGKWTCYRRNYFAVTCSFTLKNQTAEGPFYLINGQSQPDPISRFGVRISAKTAAVNNQESEARSLVQHTPKRDKESETTPKLQVIQPQSPTPIGSPGSISVNSHPYGGHQHISTTGISAFEPFSSVGPPTSYTFERIQFQKATANNGKRRAQQQYFHVIVELLADTGRSGGAEHWVVIATKQSSPMVVRGRSPGHYKDSGRRDSTTSMDPDRGSGSGGDGSNGQHQLNQSLGSQSRHHSGMDWAPPQRNGGNHYGGSNYRCNLRFGCSPVSGSSSTFTDSVTELDSEIHETTQMSPSSLLSIEEPSQMFSFQGGRPGTEESSESSISPRKGTFEEEFINVEASYEHPRRTTADSPHTSRFDFSTTPHLKAVYAS